MNTTCTNASLCPPAMALMERQPLLWMLKSSSSHPLPAPFSATSVNPLPQVKQLLHESCNIFLSKTEVCKLLAFPLALWQAGAGADTSVCVLSEIPSLTESVPSFCSNVLTPASTPQMALSARTFPENTCSQFNRIKTRTGVFSHLFLIPHLVYLKILSTSTGISNASHLSSAKYIKHDATKAQNAVLQPFFLVCVATNMQGSN